MSLPASVDDIFKMHMNAVLSMATTRRVIHGELVSISFIQYERLTSLLRFSPTNRYYNGYTDQAGIDAILTAILVGSLFPLE